jgi:glycerol-1-phosphate dehydrogenase [NAD(P)+]
MEEYIADIINLSQKCDCGNPHNPIPIEKIIIGNGALLEAASFLEGKMYKRPLIIADERTYKAAGEELSKILSGKEISHSVSMILSDENNDVVADEKSLVQALLDIPDGTDVLIAVGAGTLHDITRFCSAKMGVPFISIPTAPSVDGFTSLGAPLIIRGVKRTFQMTSPIGVFADLSILKSAPTNMIAAGFGDMIAKNTSLADWKFGHLVFGEPYCPLAAEITQNALSACEKNVATIATGDEEGVRILIESLIQSGLAMLLFGQSHPASGGEHHLSHYWEMEFLQQGRPAVLHGAKVGVSTSMLSDIYKNSFNALLKKGEALELKEDTAESKRLLNNFSTHYQEIIDIYSSIPSSSDLREWLELVGGESLPEQLGIDSELVNTSLTKAHHLRDRFTALKFFNEIITNNPVSYEYIKG